MAEKQHYPVQRKFDLKFDNTNTNLVQVDRILSMDNHRLYRQGRVYSCKIDLQTLADASESDLRVYALADTWYVRKAWQEAKMQFDLATEDEISKIGKKNLARWRDFRTYIEDITSYSPTTQIYDNDEGATTQLDGDGSYLYPSLEGNDGDAERVFSWGGATDTTQFGILKEYSDTSNTSKTPENPAGGGYTLLGDKVEEVDMNSLTIRGAQPPYDPDQFDHGSPFRLVARLNNTTGAPDTAAVRTSTGFFNAPCGIVLIKGHIQNQNVFLTVQSGDYKGVKAPTMMTQQEVKLWKQNRLN